MWLKWLSCHLQLAKVEGYDVDVPLLLIYWYGSSMHPSTVIMLESTVVLATDKENNSWNQHRFEIRHVRKSDSTQVQATRTFTVPKTERDMWVCAISQALLNLEKQKAKVRKTMPLTDVDYTLSVRSRNPSQVATSDLRPRSPIYDSVWSGDQFMTVDRVTNPVRRMGSPPSSPRPVGKLPLPRHDVLAGESLA